MRSSRLAEICSLITDGTHYTPPNVNSGVPFLTVKNISSQGMLDFEGCSKITTDEYAKAVAGNSAPTIGDVLFSKDGTVGKVSVVTAHTDFAVLSSIAILRPNSELADSKYLGYALKSPDVLDQALKKKTGSAIRRIILSDLKNVEIPLPSLPKQRRIAAILDKADALRAKRCETIAKLDQLLQSVFLEMFGDPVKNPKGWPVVSIQDACESIVDCVNRTAPTVDYVTDYKMIRTTNVRNFKVSLDSVRYVEKAVFDVWNRRLLPQKGDVILTREAPAGEAGVLDSDDQVFLGQRLMLYRVSQQRATSEYLLYALMGEGMQQQFKKQSSGSTVKHLSVPDCRSWDLMLPPVELQKKFTEIVTMNWSLRQQALAHSNRLEALFSSIQKSAFSAGP